MAKRCKVGVQYASEAIKERVRALRRQVAPLRREDVDGVHDMRVASRRLRAMLVDAGYLIPKRAREACHESVRSITRLLGRPRELDVMLGTLEAHRGSVSSSNAEAFEYSVAQLRSFREEEAPHCKEAADIVEGDQFADRLFAVFEGLDRKSKCHLDVAMADLDAGFERLYKARRKWTNGGSESDLHQVRVACKKLRYLCEIHAPLYGDGMPAFIEELKALQDLLGAWNDARVLCQELESLMREAPGHMAPGYMALIVQFRQEADEGLEALRPVADGFFKGAKRKAVRRLLASPALACCRK